MRRTHPPREASHAPPDGVSDLFGLVKAFQIVPSCRKRSSVASGFALIIVFGMGGGAVRAQQAQETEISTAALQDLFSPILPESMRTNEIVVEEGIARRRTVTIDMDLLARAGRGEVDGFRLNLFEDVSLEAVIERRYVLSPERYSILGSIRGDVAGRFNITVKNGYVSGDIQDEKSQGFEIRSGGNNRLEVRELDHGQSFICYNDVLIEQQTEQVESRSLTPTSPPLALLQNCSGGDYDDGTTITVLVVYTAWARCVQDDGDPTSRTLCLDVGTDNGPIEALIDQRIADMKEAFVQSDITTTTISLVHVEELDINYVESNDPTATPSFNQESVVGDMDAIRIPTDGVLDEVPLIRDYYYADWVVILSNFPGIGGVAAVVPGSIETLENSSEKGYVIMDPGFWFPFPHELGHLMGCDHQLIEPFNFRFGLFDYSLAWRLEANGTDYFTVLSTGGGDFRINRYSQSRGRFPGRGDR